MTKPTKPTNPRFFMTDVSKRQQRNDNLRNNLRNNAWAILIAVLIVFALPLLLSVIATR